jgi:hypothetical protein
VLVLTLPTTEMNAMVRLIIPLPEHETVKVPTRKVQAEELQRQIQENEKRKAAVALPTTSAAQPRPATSPAVLTIQDPFPHRRVGQNAQLPTKWCVQTHSQATKQGLTGSCSGRGHNRKLHGIQPAKGANFHKPKFFFVDKLQPPKNRAATSKAADRGCSSRSEWGLLKRTPLRTDELKACTMKIAHPHYFNGRSNACAVVNGQDLATIRYSQVELADSQAGMHGVEWSSLLQPLMQTVRTPKTEQLKQINKEASVWCESLMEDGAFSPWQRKSAFCRSPIRTAKMSTALPSELPRCHSHRNHTNSFSDVRFYSDSTCFSLLHHLFASRCVIGERIQHLRRQRILSRAPEERFGAIVS